MVVVGDRAVIVYNTSGNLRITPLIAPFINGIRPMFKEYVRLGSAIVLYVYGDGRKLAMPAMLYVNPFGYVLYGLFDREPVEYLVRHGVAVITWRENGICDIAGCRLRATYVRGAEYCMCIPGGDYEGEGAS